VFAADGRQLGAVAVGVLLHDVEREIARARSIIYLAVGVGLLVGVAGASPSPPTSKKPCSVSNPSPSPALSRNATLPSSPSAKASSPSTGRPHHRRQRRSARILKKAGLGGDFVGRKITDIIASTRLHEVLESGRVELDQVQNINGVEILTNRMPIRVDGHVVGAIATFRDKTEIRLLAEQLSGIRAYAEASAPTPTNS
jgi:CitB family two-component system sensor histidine kinase MalK